jgi:hypothetical protein
MRFEPGLSREDIGSACVRVYDKIRFRCVLAGKLRGPSAQPVRAPGRA